MEFTLIILQAAVNIEFPLVWERRLGHPVLLMSVTSDIKLGSQSVSVRIHLISNNWVGLTVGYFVPAESQILLAPINWS